MRGEGTSVDFHPISSNVSMPKQNCFQNPRKGADYYRVSIWGGSIKYDISLFLQRRDKVTDHSFNILLYYWKFSVLRENNGCTQWKKGKRSGCLPDLGCVWEGVYLKVFEEKKADAIAWVSHTCMKTLYITFVLGKPVIPLWSPGLHSFLFICMMFLNIKFSTWLW